MNEDVKFRLEVAARVLERAASRTNDQELKDQLLKLASSLRSFNISSLRDVEVTGVRAKTIDDVVKEIREFIWKPSPREHTERKLEKKVLKPLEEFEKLLEDIDKKLEELLL